MLVHSTLITRKAGPEARQQVAYGAVYMPDVVDSQGDFMRADEIRKAAHGFLARGTTDAVDVHHNNQKSGAHIVESFLTRKGDPDFPMEGTWVVGIHVPDPDLWAQIEKGEIGGLSMEVLARRANGVEIGTDRIAKYANGRALGRTYKTGDHEHEYTVAYGPDGQFLGGQTDTVNGHSHVIKAGVSTEEADNHRHRFSTIEHFEVTAQKIGGTASITYDAHGRAHTVAPTPGQVRAADEMGGQAESFMAHLSEWSRGHSTGDRIWVGGHNLYRNGHRSWQPGYWRSRAQTQGRR